MYYYLKGTIVSTSKDYAVIDVHDVGYEFLTLHEDDFIVGEQSLVYTYHIVREDDEFFVGFKSLEEKEIFVQLVSVKGIGPKTAIGALRGTTISRFVEMIQHSDIKALKSLPGIGPKAAAQIVLDLKGSLTVSQIETKDAAKTEYNKEQLDAMNVLKALGFKAKDIETVFKKLPSVLTAQELVEEALKRLGAN